VFVRPWCAVHRHYPEFSALEQHQIAELGMAKLDCLFEHGLKYGSKLTGRARNGLKHIRRRRLLLQSFGQIAGTLAQLFEQPSVLDGDDGLAGEAGKQLGLLVAERADLLAVDGNSADQLVLLEHRDDDESTSTGLFN